ncbi:MAG: polyprenyl synthetase family protein [Microthrixaceae bacterium]
MSGPNPLAVLPTMSSDLERVEDGLLTSVASGEDFLTEIASHLISAGGKRVRPGFCIASAATNTTEDAPAPQEAVTGGVAVELVHLGSLYHDDVMDEAETRRTVQSVNARWGNMRAILAGDFLLARPPSSPPGWGWRWRRCSRPRSAGSARASCSSCSSPTTPHAARRATCARSTARPPRCSHRPAGSGRSSPTPPGAHRGVMFGHAHGMAFQMVDDVLDLVATEESSASRRATTW